MDERTGFLGAVDGYEAGDWVILGAPLDETTTFSKGTDKGPDAIRRASDCLEEYCPRLDRSLLDIGLADIGDIPLDVVPFPKNLEFIRNAVSLLVKRQARPLLLGGEHTVTIPAFEALLEVFPDLVLVQIDAHADLRIDYEGSTISHACVVRRIEEQIGPARILQVGIRSGTREEWKWMRENNTLVSMDLSGTKKLQERIKDRPVYLTVDLDILDPSVLPGTGTPEPGGVSYLELDRFIRQLSALNIVAADVVELSPGLDSSGVSAVVASKVIRTMLLSL
jgi:agmatinase